LAGYLTTVEFKALTIAPAAMVDTIEVQSPGWTQAQLDYWSAWIDSRLRKRCEVPFSTPYPVAVTGWLQRIVTRNVYLRRGVNATDEQWVEVQRDHTDAKAEIGEAADGKEGLYELPLRADTTATAVSKGGPLSYSEVSPYTWSPLQRDAAEDEG
jgi:hypothetical protein